MAGVEVAEVMATAMAVVTGVKPVSHRGGWSATTAGGRSFDGACLRWSWRPTLGARRGAATNGGLG